MGRKEERKEGRREEEVKGEERERDGREKRLWKKEGTLGEHKD